MTESTPEPLADEQSSSSSTGRPSSMGRDVMTVAIIAILALMLGVNLFLFFDDGGVDIEGVEAPNFELPVMESEDTKELADYRGQVVIMDFWATWCPPCYEQVPALDEIKSDPKWSDRVQILSINADPPTDDRKELIREFVEEVDKSLVTLIDDGKVQNLYGATTLPTLVVVNPEGSVVYVSEGVHDAERLKELIRKADS